MNTGSKPQMAQISRKERKPNGTWPSLATLSLTPRFSGVSYAHDERNRFSGFQWEAKVVEFGGA